MSSASPSLRERLKKNLPSIEDAARFYERVAGVKAADFVNASKSFSVDLKMRQADAQIIAMQVSGTPTLVVNGKYRLNNENLQTNDQMIELVKFLVAKESAPPAAAAPPRRANRARAGGASTAAAPATPETPAPR